MSPPPSVAFPTPSATPSPPAQLFHNTNGSALSTNPVTTNNHAKTNSASTSASTIFEIPETLRISNFILEAYTSPKVIPHLQPRPSQSISHSHINKNNNNNNNNNYNPSCQSQTNTLPSSPSAQLQKSPLPTSSIICKVCTRGHCDSKLLLCDNCDGAWHIFCLSPPLKRVPRGRWVCDACCKIEGKVRHGLEARVRRIRDCLNRIDEDVVGIGIEFGMDGVRTKLPLKVGMKRKRGNGENDRIGRNGSYEDEDEDSLRLELFWRKVERLAKEVAEVLVAGEGMGLESVRQLEADTVRVIAGLQEMFNIDETKRSARKAQRMLPWKKRGTVSKDWQYDQSGIDEEGKIASKVEIMNEICKNSRPVDKNRSPRVTTPRAAAGAVLLPSSRPQELVAAEFRDQEVGGGSVSKKRSLRTPHAPNRATVRSSLSTDASGDPQSTKGHLSNISCPSLQATHVHQEQRGPGSILQSAVTRSRSTSRESSSRDASDIPATKHLVVNRGQKNLGVHSQTSKAADSPKVARSQSSQSPVASQGILSSGSGHAFYRKNKRGRPATRNKQVSTAPTVPIAIAPAKLERSDSHPGAYKESRATNTRATTEGVVGERRIRDYTSPETGRVKRIRPLDLSQVRNENIENHHGRSAHNQYVPQVHMRGIPGPATSLLSSTIFSPMHRGRQQVHDVRTSSVASNVVSRVGPPTVHYR